MKHNIYSIIRLNVFFVALISAVFSCAKLGSEKTWDNPFDPDGTNYFPPEVFASSDTIIAAGKELQLSATGSDKNGNIKYYFWSFDHGQTWDTVEAAKPFQKTWTKKETGLHTVWVQSIDNDGLASLMHDSLTVDVHLYAPVINHLCDTLVSQKANVNITFKASDTNGTIVKYLIGHGQNGWDDSTTTPSYTFSHPEGGTLNIKWAAVDNDSNITSDTFKIIFNRGPDSAGLLKPVQGVSPFKFFDFGDSSGTVETKFTASDPDGIADTLSYIFFLAKQGTDPVKVYSGRVPNYSAEGLLPSTKYSWTLFVKDLFGDSTSASGVFTTAQQPSGPSGMKLVKSKNLSYTMGQSGFASCEIPVHIVSFSHNFWMDSVEVTNSDFRAVLGTGITNNLPVSEISWFDAVLYCNARSKRDKLDTVYSYSAITGTLGQKCTLQNLKVDTTKAGYRLPTEAEWEYACRAGNSGLFFWGNNRIEIETYAWINATSSNNVHEVAKKKPNSFGIYDMSGNVWEWCNDWFGPDYYSASPKTDPSGPSDGQERVIRGGSWMHSDYYAQSGTRSKLHPETGNSTVGFRAVLVNK
jgi:formylglycine-generating enzyme required for sulfatase activity